MKKISDGIIFFVMYWGTVLTLAFIVDKLLAGHHGL